MNARRLGGDEQLTGNFAIGQAASEQLEYLVLPSGQAEARRERASLGGGWRVVFGPNEVDPGALGEAADLRSVQFGAHSDSQAPRVAEQGRGLAPRRPAGQKRFSLPPAGVGGEIWIVGVVPVADQLGPRRLGGRPVQSGPLGLGEQRVGTLVGRGRATRRVDLGQEPLGPADEPVGVGDRRVPVPAAAAAPGLPPGPGPMPPPAARPP